MKKIDALLRKAKRTFKELLAAIGCLFPPDDDEFIDALGKDPENYKASNPDGSVGYDFMAALYDTVEDDWLAEEWGESGEELEDEEQE